MKKFINKFRFFLKKLEQFEKAAAIFIIRGYKRWIGGQHGLFFALGLSRGASCVFLPTCSEYTVEAISKYGVIHGSFLGIKRILRCHPWQKNRYDPIP